MWLPCSVACCKPGPAHLSASLFMQRVVGQQHVAASEIQDVGRIPPSCQSSLGFKSAETAAGFGVCLIFDCMPPKRKASDIIIKPETVLTRRGSKISKDAVSDAGKVHIVDDELPLEPQTSYEDIRRRNIAKIQLEMQHIGLSAAAAAFVPIATTASSNRSSHATASRGKKSHLASEPLRMSLRARDGDIKPKRDIYTEAAFEIQEQRERMQRRPAPFSVEESWFKDLGSSEHESRSLSHGVFAAMRRCATPKVSMNPKAVAAAEFYGRLRVHSSGYGKLVPDRIYSICMHPSRDSIIGFVGDKFGLTPIILFSSSFFSLQISFSASGKLGIVNYGTSIDAFKSSSIPFADMDAEFAQKRVCLEAHKETISCIAFPRSSIGANCDAAATSVFTSSYDGSIRALDIDRAIFFDIAVRAADDEYLVHSIRFIDSHTLWYSTSDGDIRMADVRSSAADNAKMPSHKVHSKKVGCVDVKNQSTLLTASNDATIALWDSRYMKKNPSPIDSFSSTCTMQCAYFSPSGDTIVAQNARDMNFLFFEGSTSTFSSGGFNAASALKVPHNNNTGRFTTTFRSVWDPKYDRVFCIGSMDQPRGFDVFGANYSFSKPASLDFRAKVTGALVTNVPASLAPHGSLPVVFAGNSSGRVTLFISP